MEITWLGHSSFQLRNSSVTLITDPYSGEIGFAFPDVSANVITISNDHPNHSSYAGIKGDPRVFNGPGEYEVGGVFINSWRTPAESDEDPLNTTYLIEIDGVMICHLGDLTRTLNARLSEDLGRAQVLLVPVGGHCTLALGQVAEVISQLEPRLVIPMHFKDGESKVELEPIEPFLRELGIQEPVRQSRITVTSSTLPRELQVIIPERAT
jgi:L-ascorbate metabolism protein UlaG (beta-lactamase superfamily)